MPIKRKIAEKLIKSGKFAGPITLKFRLNGKEFTKTFVINPTVLQKVINGNGECPCKPGEKCLCPAFLKTGYCKCQLFIEVAD